MSVRVEVKNHPGFVARYFPRRLAEARRRKTRASPVESAMAETISIFFALCHCISIERSLHDVDLRARRGPILVPRITAVSRSGVGRGVVGGRTHFFGWRFGHYVRDPSATIGFDSEDDRRIVFRQTLVLTVLYIFVIPIASIMVMWQLG
jgi:hypothetical protein